MENQNNNQNERSFTRRPPDPEITINTSKDGKYCIVKVVQTFIKPVNYVQTILDNGRQSAGDTMPPDAEHASEQDWR